MNFDLDATVDCLKDNSGRIHARVVGTSTRGYSKEAVSLGLYLAGVGYFSEALLYLEPAINNWGNLPDLLLQEVGECWSLTLYALGQREQLRRFVRGPATSLKSKSKALCLLKLSWAELMAGDVDASMAASEKARKTCDLSSSHEVLAEYLYLDGYRLLSHFGDPAAAEVKIDQACALFRLHSKRLLLAHALQARANIQWGLGHSGYAEALAAESLSIAAAIGNPRTAAAALRQIGIFEYSQSQFSESKDILSMASQIHRDYESQVSSYHLKTQLALAKLSLLIGKHDEAQGHLDDIGVHKTGLTGSSLAMWHEFRGIAQTQRLDYMAALASFDEAKKCLGASGTTTYELAEVYWQEAEVHLAMQNPRIALDLANDALEVVQACGNPRERGQILRVKATALSQLARPEEAIPLLNKAASELRRRNNPLELGKTLIQLAAVLEPDPATDAAEEALAIFSRLELSALANDAREARDLARLRAHASQRTEEKNRTVRKEGTLVAESPRMKAILTECQLIAHSTSPAVIMGATGVGKEVVARYIHEHSGFADGPFVAVNCAALPESLFERELFGHKKGAFTGADRDTAGVVAAATSGTLFLDEIGELPMAMQAKLLRLLQEGTYRRVGDVVEYTADIRILAATNCDLRRQVEEKSFREDLWYRINAFEVRVPPLRERTEDIAPLTDLFLEEQSEEYGIEFWMDKQARRLFERYPWPGNVRELQSAVRAGAARARERGCVRVQHLPHSLRESRGKKPPPILSLQQHLEVEERRIILHALRKCKNSRSEAARYLGIGRNTLYEKMQRLGIALDKEAKG